MREKRKKRKRERGIFKGEEEKEDKEEEEEKEEENNRFIHTSPAGESTSCIFPFKKRPDCSERVG